MGGGELLALLVGDDSRDLRAATRPSRSLCTLTNSVGSNLGGLPWLPERLREEELVNPASCPAQRASFPDC